MTNFLANRINSAIKKNLAKAKLTNEDIEAVLSEIKLALLEADVNLIVVKAFIDNIRNQVQGQYLLDGLNAEKMLIKIVHDQLINIMGQTTKQLQFKAHPAVMMVVGLQGSGKTTTIVKLAKLIEKQSQKKVMLVACDIYRPAAIEQLKTLANQANIDVYANENEKDVSVIAKAAIDQAIENKSDVVLIDTAGRLHIDEGLMKELESLKKTVHPQEIIIVVDAMTGQDMTNVAIAFDQHLKLTGAIISKLDGDTKGGAALSISYLVKIPLLFIGLGEMIDQLAVFHPDRMADRILGLGDVKTLIEKAKDVNDERTIQKTMNRIMVGAFDLNDLLNQMRQVDKMGKLGSIMKLIPGMNNMSEDKVAVAQEKFKVTEALLNSMTKKERRVPKLLKQQSRKIRIIKGSGRSEKEYNALITQFEKSKKTIEQLAREIKSGKMIDFTKISSLIS